MNSSKNELTSLPNSASCGNCAIPLCSSHPICCQTTCCYNSNLSILFLQIKLSFRSLFLHLEIFLNFFEIKIITSWFHPYFKGDLAESYGLTALVAISLFFIIHCYALKKTVCNKLLEVKWVDISSEIEGSRVNSPVKWKIWKNPVKTIFGIFMVLYYDNIPTILLLLCIIIKSGVKAYRITFMNYSWNMMETFS